VVPHEPTAGLVGGAAPSFSTYRRLVVRDDVVRAN
jgi:hypothetical protein